ncbi:Uncharacterised protein [Yersinia aldovae]|uniref:Uncharacterized protein n=1 Tax=Yersinia aldovae TaxID=29483 RepID=A0A0T9T0H8_YERAL|nr:Uncharacterised protein [Yersinia aldovae]CNK52100.1 Uncharacterised protein [Yersinia aldovae]CNK60610.1 Uncharacterised protein [Yersinia aldovae]
MSQQLESVEGLALYLGEIRVGCSGALYRRPECSIVRS